MKPNNHRTRITILLIFLVATLCLPENIQAGIPVFDELNYLLNRLIFKWQQWVYKDIIANLKDFRSLSELNYISFMVKHYGLTSGELLSLTPGDIGEILRLGAFITDKLKKDTWSDIWQRVQVLTQRFKELLNFDYILNNPMYRQNRAFRAFVDRNIEIEREQVKDVENLLELFTTLREIEGERLDLFGKYEDLLKKYGGIHDPKTGAAQTGKLLTLTAFILLENLKADMQTNLLIRSFLEQAAKRNIWSLDHFHRTMELNKDNPEVWRR
jgi:hypothetical protein